MVKSNLQSFKSLWYILFFYIYFGLITSFIVSAQAYSFTFDKVFDHSASQEHVFIEISQLVQSALDGYKV
jgi:Na+-transporting NADH:ubiquinone oxidoreductase subunit NqrC